jgi:hypothetical protein
MSLIGCCKLSWPAVWPVMAWNIFAFRSTAETLQGSSAGRLESSSVIFALNSPPNELVSAIELLNIVLVLRSTTEKMNLGQYLRKLPLPINSRYTTKTSTYHVLQNISLHDCLARAPDSRHCKSNSIIYLHAGPRSFSIDH